MDPAVGTRIRRLREAAGLKAQDLADRVGLDATALSKIENGRRSVKSNELARLADALKVSPLALLEDDPLLSNFPVAAHRAGSSIAVEHGAYERLVSLTELHVVLADAGIPTSPDLAPVPPVAGVDWLDDAETLADWARSELPLTASGDQRLAQLVDRIESRLSIDVLIEPFAGDPLSGAALIDRSFPLLFVNGDHSRPRSLFTLAHELGHLLAQRADDGIALDRELAGSTDSERLANAFAASYLMPESEISLELEKYRRVLSTLVRLTDLFGVSYETLVYRLHSLRLVDAEGRDRLTALNWHELVDRSARALRGTEIGRLHLRDQKPEGHVPGMLVQRAFQGYHKGVLSIRPLAGLLRRDQTELLQQLTSGGDMTEEFEHLDSAQLNGNATEESTKELFSGRPI
jgi:Zn-dependent peptidase ImmA (M78 family)/transcriptional regulator with XRE-family HTH domain